MSNITVPWGDKDMLPFIGKRAFGDIDTAIYTNTEIRSWQTADTTPRGMLRVLGPERGGVDGDPPASDETVDERIMYTQEYLLEDDHARVIFAPRGARKLSISIHTGNMFYGALNTFVVNSAALEECAIDARYSTYIGACPNLKKLYVRGENAFVYQSTPKVMHCESYRPDWPFTFSECTMNLDFERPVVDNEPCTSERVVVMRYNGSPKIVVKLRVEMRERRMPHNNSFRSDPHTVYAPYMPNRYPIRVVFKCHDHGESYRVNVVMQSTNGTSCIDRCEIWTVNGARLRDKYGITVEGNIRNLLIPSRSIETEHTLVTKCNIDTTVGVVDGNVMKVIAALSGDYDPVKGRESKKLNLSSTSTQKPLPHLPIELLGGPMYSMLFGNEFSKTKR